MSLFEGFMWVRDCVCMCVCVSVNSPACQWTLKSGGHREPAQLKAAAAWSPSLATCFAPPQAEWWFVVFAHLFTHFICWQAWYLIFSISLCCNNSVCFGYSVEKVCIFKSVHFVTLCFLQKHTINASVVGVNKACRFSCRQIHMNSFLMFIFLASE